jgi:glycosyltransferase involved in cell wall biosynthesis
MRERIASGRADKRMTKQRICIVPKVHGVGGMVSFLHKFSTAVEKVGVEVTNDLTDTPYDAVLVIGGTREILSLYRVRQHTLDGHRGVRVVQRLDGINWIHRKRPISMKHSFRAEYGNFVLSLIRRSLADRIVYQSEFSRVWWNDWFGPLKTPYSVVHNGVDLDVYLPGDGRPEDLYRLLVVEGTMGGGYESGLENAVRLAEATAKLVSKPLELMVVGEVSEALKTEWRNKSTVPITWAGLVTRNDIPRMMREAHALFSADVHPACPNSVIEALACGLPVVAYDTGSLAELVTAEAGCVVPYGSNAWNLEPPVVDPLARCTARVLENQDKFRAGARQRAEAAFGLQEMMMKYLDALLG